jgi:hypothetical protein
MSDLTATVILIGGLSVFIASLFYVRAYYQYRKATKDLFVWNPDPRTTRIEISVLEDELAKAVERGSIDKAAAVQIAKGALRSRHLLLSRLLNLDSLTKPR